MNSKFQHVDLNISACDKSSATPPYTFNSTKTAALDNGFVRRRTFVALSNELDEPSAVFALGNFFGEGEVFVAVPWQSLHFAITSQSANAKVFTVGKVSRKFERTIVASVEIKPDSSGCIKVTARKNSVKGHDLAI